MYQPCFKVTSHNIIYDISKNQIEIFCGLEYEMFSSVPTEGFDYLIGSVHYIDINGKKLGFDRGVKEAEAFVRDNFGGDGMAFAKRYFENVSQCNSRCFI